MSEAFRSVDPTLKIRHLVAAVCVLAGAAPGAHAAEILDAVVDVEENRYEVRFAVILNGEVDRLKRIITDHETLTALSPTVVQSRVLTGRSGGEARIEVTLRPCVLLVFCKTIRKVSDVRVDAGGSRVQYRIVPALSDFDRGSETITLEHEPAGNGPRVRFVYSAVLEPKFFVPPVVGPWLIRRQIIEDLRTSSRRAQEILQDKDETHE